MFPSAGYFRSANCPFFIHGLCHRPYCHFRHAKPGQGSTSKTTAKGCLKTAKSAFSKTDSTDAASTSQALDINTNKEASTFSSSQSVKERSNESNSSATINKDTPQNNDNIPKPAIEKDKPAGKASSSILESLNKLEQAVEEATATLHNTKKNTDSLIAHKSNTKVGVKVGHQTQEPDLASNDSENSKNNLEISSETEKTASMPRPSENTVSNESLPLNDSTITSAVDAEITSSAEILPHKGQSNIKKEQVSLKSSKESSKVVCDVHPKTATAKRVLNVDSSTVVKKKRKNSNNSDTVSETKTKSRDKDIGDSVTSADNTNQSFPHDHENLIAACGSEEKLDTILQGESTSLSKKGENSTGIQKIRDKAIDNKLQNVHAKRALKKKRKLVDINFFSSPSKKLEPKTQQTTKKTKTINSKSTNEAEKREKDNPKLKTMRKYVNPKKINQNEAKKDLSSSKSLESFKKKHVVNSIDSLFESDDEAQPSSDSLSESEQDTMDSATESLKEIFDNYKPEKSKANTVVPTTTPCGSSRVVSVDTTSPAKDKSSSTMDVQGLIKKKRIAHNPSYLVQRKTSRINPARHYPKNAPSIPAQDHSQPSSSERNAIQGERKRVAHVPKPTAQTSTLRPRIPIEYGAKVPQNLRQRYLDKIIDENLRLYATEKEAFEKAIEEERNIYERSTRRTVYMNLCVNALTKLRTEPTPEFQPLPTPPPVSTSAATTEGETSTASSKSLQKLEVNLTEEGTYDLLSAYVLDEDQLVENGYPRHCPSNPGRVTFKTRRPATTPSKDPNRRTCCRCGRPYSVREDGTHVRQEQCVYHVGRLFRRRIAGDITSSYQCCGGDASTPGCAVCKFHVSEGKNSTEGFMTTIISPLAGRQKKVFGLDCEMCYTIGGLELTRVTVVDWKLDKIYDTFVKPDNPILDYNTRFSGVTQECLRGVKTSIREVQAVLLSMISKDSILVGHSLESDLLSLKLVHSNIVDTSVVFPHRLGPPYKRALRTLMAEFLKKIIQNSESGHDSYEDAAASLELMLYKVKDDLRKKGRQKK